MDSMPSEKANKLVKGDFEWMGETRKRDRSGRRKIESGNEISCTTEHFPLPAVVWLITVDFLISPATDGKQARMKVKTRRHSANQKGLTQAFN